MAYYVVALNPLARPVALHRDPGLVSFRPRKTEREKGIFSKRAPFFLFVHAFHTTRLLCCVYKVQINSPQPGGRLGGMIFSFLLPLSSAPRRAITLSAKTASSAFLFPSTRNLPHSGDSQVWIHMQSESYSPIITLNADREDMILSMLSKPRGFPISSVMRK